MHKPDNTEENLREELGIPLDAIVFGCHGGASSFDIRFVQEVVKDIARVSPTIYFVFLNIQQFCEFPNVIFLPGTADVSYKDKFINSCDAMLHARVRGESFGLACAEFSVHNKPVITRLVNPENAHVAILKDKAFYYTNEQDLADILLSFEKNRDSIRKKNWDAYSEIFSPEKVMAQFDAVFIQPLL